MKFGSLPEHYDYDLPFLTSFFVPYGRSGRVTHADKISKVFRKYKSQVRYNVKSFGEIQMTIFEKYSKKRNNYGRTRIIN